jgi:hypothetical protein
VANAKLRKLEHRDAVEQLAKASAAKAMHDDPDETELDEDDEQYVEQYREAQQPKPAAKPFRGNPEVADILKAAGRDPRYAAFYPEGSSSDEESVHEWIGEQAVAGLFGVVPDPEVDEETATSIDRISRAVGNAPVESVGSLAGHVDALKSARSREEFYALLNKAGVRTTE